MGAEAGSEAAATGNVAADGGIASRVGALRDAIPAAQQGRVTGVGIGEDASGNMQVLVGTSEKGGYLRPGVRGTLEPGETVVKGGMHAERNIVNHANANGLKLREVGASRPICSDCAKAIQGAGARAVTPLKVAP